MPIKDPKARRAYHREYNRKRYHSDPEFRQRILDRVKVNDERYREKTREIVGKFKAEGCKFCSETELCCLSAHHLDPSKKLFSIAEAPRLGISSDKVSKELEKCICVCENCHRKIHAGVLRLQ